MKTSIRPARLLPLVLLVPAVLLPAYRGEEPRMPGSIVGVVRYTGKVPPAQKIATTDGGTIEHNDLVVDGKSKGLRWVVAVLDDAPAQPKLEKAKPVLIDQRDMIFLPRVTAIQHGQPVRFENNDICNHSVQSSSTTKANQFNQVAAPNQPIEHTFELQKRPVVIGCSLHAWMRAYVYVVPHPWFAVSDEKGAFRIDKVSPGKYVLLLAHPDTNHQERRAVTVTAGKTTEVTVEWDKVATK
ncbi:MAG: hypothetical protein K2R98_26670 [Gemmataceae bacterium]|nr:hypothetical protein [Gemmataceae bacterium]